MIGAAHPTVHSLGDNPFRPGSPGGEMKCPTCGENTPDSWKPLYAVPEGSGGFIPELEGPQSGSKIVQLDWMHCANGDCGELVIRVHESYSASGHRVTTASYLARSRFRERPLDPLVVDRYRQDYEEASAILDISPRMSAVLSRSILADLLEEFAALDQFSLAARIEKFIEDTSRPHELRQNLHYLREIADLSAHTKKNDQAEPVSVTREEAEWTLNVVDRLFDHFIVTPEKDRRLREAMDVKLEEAGRKPISPLPVDEGDETSV
jgi:hypothetical protein